MILSGAQVTGVKASGKRTLASIGDVIWWFDHRRMVTVNSSDRVTRWGSIASNYNVSQVVHVPGQGPFYYEGEGIGRKGPVHGQGANSMRGPTGVMVQRFHSGEKYALLAVGYKNNNGSTANDAYDLVSIRNAVNTSDSYVWRPIVRQGTNILSIDGEVEQQESAMGNDQYTLLGAVYYGPDKENNVRLIGGSAQSMFTNTIEMPVDNSLAGRLFSIVNWANALPTQLAKMFIAYNLNHLTDDNINNVFLPLFYSTLKEDAEYSSIVTP